MENLKEEGNKLKYNKLSEIAFILSLGSLLLIRIIPIIGLITILSGFITGIIAIKKIKRTKEKGKWLAITSIVIGGILLIVFISVFVWSLFSILTTTFKN